MILLREIGHSRLRCRLILLSLAGGMAMLVAGCSTLPPGADFPKTHTVTVPSAGETRLGSAFRVAGSAHQSMSGFHIFTAGVDGFLARIELINAAEHSLDLQYYIFRGDETGGLIREALKQAALRGVHVRILVDDADTLPGDERLFALTGMPNIEIRIYNPWRYRGHLGLFRSIEYLTHHSRLDYRMHNKLLIADQAVALAGGRNIGDQYFQVDPESQFADDDVFTVGENLATFRQSFAAFWNSDLAIPSEALYQSAKPVRDPPAPHLPQSKVAIAGLHLPEKLAGGEPLKSLLSGDTKLVWARAQVVYDSPDKKDVRDGLRAGRLMYGPVASAAASAQRETLMITPYLVPSGSELQLIQEQRAKNARVAILTNSLESAPELSAHAGYIHNRPRLLREGVELYEVRSLLQSTRGSGQSKRISEFGNYALHAKLLVFDRERLYIGSMNLDRRSHSLNTELGLIIDSKELAEESARRFDAMTRPESAYSVNLREPDQSRSSRLLWRCRDNGNLVEYSREPAKSPWQRLKVQLLSLLPLDPEL